MVFFVWLEIYPLLVFSAQKPNFAVAPQPSALGITFKRAIVASLQQRAVKSR
jgi:hypothetical protein